MPESERRQRLPRWVPSAFVSAASTLLCLLALELSARCYFGVELLTMQNWRQVRIVRSTLSLAAAYDPVLGWAPTPHFASPAINTLAFGVRKGRADERELRTGGVLAVGDSFTAGSEVSDEESWPAQLEKRIGRPVINGGVGGYGTDQILMRAEQLLPIVQPDIVLIGFLSSDILRAGFSSYGRPKPYYTVENDRLVLRNSPVPRAMPFQPSGNLLVDGFRRVAAHSYLADHLLSRAYPELWLGSDRQVYVRNQSDEVEVTCKLLRAFQSKLDARGVRAYLVLQHGHSDISQLERPAGYARLVSDCAARLGITVIDEFESLRAIHRADPRALERYYVMRPGGIVGHMSARGNAHVARLVADALEQPTHAGAIRAPESRLDDVPDGRNLLPASESLTRLLGPQPTAVLELGAATPGGPREFRMSSTGTKSEHYLTAQLDLPPAFYVLSLEARADPSARLKVQLHDSAGNGTMARFDLASETALTERLGMVRGPAARIRSLGDGWYHLAVLAGLPAAEPRLLIQLLDASGASLFAPQGEALRIRAVQLERGRRPTPYKATSGPLRLGFMPSGGADLIGNAIASALQPSAIAMLRPVARSPGEYRLTAAGGSSEHYVGIAIPKLHAGAHTLSLELALETGAGPRLHLHGVQSQGVIADFDLAQHRAPLWSTSPDESADAGVQVLDSGWMRIWLTATLPEGDAAVVLQLRDAAGNTSFAPQRESIRMRALRLQRGEGPPTAR